MLVHLNLNLLFYSFILQSISAPGSGIWSDGKDKNDGSQAHTWNVEVLIDVVKEVVRELLVHPKWSFWTSIKSAWRLANTKGPRLPK